MLDPARTAAARPAWTVAGLVLAAGDALAARFGAVTVRGELSGWARAGSGHCYFALKDPGGTALLRCALFKRAAAWLDFQPADGMQVELRGRLAVYESRGELQLVAESLSRLGAGTLYEEFLRLRARLEADGVFDAARKRPIAAMPRALGIVTSPGAAALHDVLTCLARRAPQVRVVVYPSPVQGADAPAALMRALRLAATRAEVETLLVVRGGGSIEDLWAFNDERVVRAVAASPIPVVVGVGHETDLTLADLAADLRAPTPTAAAELAAPALAALAAALAARSVAVVRALRRALDRHAERLDMAGLRLGRPAEALRGHRQRLQLAQQRLGGATAARLQRATSQLAVLRERLAAVDPARVLRRGYAWIEGGDGHPVTSALALAPGQRVQAVWHDGRADAEVLRVLPAPPAET